MEFSIADKGGFQSRPSALVVKKTSDFSKFMLCPHGQGRGGVEPVRTFFVQGKGGKFFAIWCRRLRMESH